MLVSILKTWILRYLCKLEDITRNSFPLCMWYEDSHISVTISASRLSHYLENRFDIAQLDIVVLSRLFFLINKGFEEE